jgi:hypothetical protein
MIKKIKDIFKKNNNVMTPIKNKKESINIGNKIYAIESTSYVPVQEVPFDRKVYGWTLETRYKDNRGNYYPWCIYSNKKVYSTRSSAIEAGIKISKVSYYASKDIEYRVGALYMMDTMEWRDYKINEILVSSPREIDYTIQAWKVKEDFVNEWGPNTITSSKSKITYKKGTLFIKYGDDILISGTSNSFTRHGMNYTFANLKSKGCLFEEVDIMNEKWVHPHLIIDIKNKLNVR